jgi:predicted nucleic acid-binding protein
MNAEFVDSNILVHAHDPTTPAKHERARSLVERLWQVSFWDAMLLVAAKASGAGRLWSEDLTHGQTVNGVEISNPFLES